MRYGDVEAQGFLRVTLLANAAEEAALAAPDGSIAYRTDLDRFRLRRNGAWGPLTPTGYIDGLLSSFSSVTQVQIAAGFCLSDDDTFDIISAGTLTADITASGANGLDAGIEAADTWYSIWIIAGGGNPVASLLSTSATTPTLPGTYTVKRRVGWVYNDAASNFREFAMFNFTGRDRIVKYDNVDEDVVQVLDGGTATTFTNVDLTTLVPPTSAVAIIDAVHNGEGFPDFVSFRPDGGTAATPAQRVFGGDGTTEFWIRCPGQIIEYENAFATDDTYAWVMGYVDSL